MIMITADNAMQTLYQMAVTQPYVTRTYATTVRKFTPDSMLAPQRRELKLDLLLMPPPGSAPAVSSSLLN